MSYVIDFLVWLWAVFISWAGLATGGIIVALVWLWSGLRQKPTSRKAAIVLASLFLLLALFGAWHDQFKRAQTLEQRAIATAPYLSLQKAEIKPVKNVDSGQKLYDVLSLEFQELNEHAATGIHGYLLIIDGELKGEPLYNRNIGMANDLGRNAPLNVTTPVQITTESLGTFVFCELIYRDAFAREGREFSQAWYHKFLGSSQGVYMATLPDATLEEKARIDAYLTKREIPIP